MATLLDLVGEVHDQLYSYTQAKDRFVYLAADINNSVTTLTLTSATEARQIQSGQILQFSTDDTTVSELMRVKSVDTATFVVTVQRGVRGTTAQAWTASTCEIQIEPEFPRVNIIREINNTITSFPPAVWGFATQTTTVNSTYVDGYALPAGAVGVVSIQFLPAGQTNSWERVRRWKYDHANNTVTVFQLMETGQALKIRYRKYPTAMSLLTETLTDAGLEESVKDLVVLGTMYRLLLGRASGRLLDDRAETLSNASQRTAEPVMAAVRQLKQLYEMRLSSERERQRLANPVLPHIEF